MRGVSSPEAVGESVNGVETAGSATPPPQQPKWDVFTFRALRPGATTLKFTHGRVAAGDESSNRHAEVRVEVKSR